MGLCVVRGVVRQDMPTRLRFTPAPIMLEAVSHLFALRHHILDEIFESAEALCQSDWAMMLPRAPAWAEHGSLRQAMAFRRQANSLSPHLRDVLRP